MTLPFPNLMSVCHGIRCSKESGGF